VVLLIMLPVRPVVGKPGLPGSFQTGLAVLADPLTTAAVFVVWVTYPTPACNLTAFQCT